MKTSAVHARIEPQTKEKAEEILRSLGLTPTEAIRIFYKQISLRRVAFPDCYSEQADGLDPGKEPSR